MGAVDLIVIGLVAVIVLGAVLYIRKEKKKGTQCIGCPCSGSCSGENACCSCGKEKME